MKFACSLPILCLQPADPGAVAMPKIRTVAFDADDTLWHNERYFHLTQARFAELLADYADPDHLAERLIAAERRNLGHYGFGIKGFVLSMIETAIEVTDARVPARVIGDLIAAGQEMLSHPVELLPHARETIAALTGQRAIMLITKGDLLDQERKLAQSGLGDLFDAVEIVSHKTPETYAQIFARLDGGAGATLMAGNSLRSDVAPVLAAGGWAVHVPHDLTWALEQDDMPVDNARFFTASDLGHLPGILADIDILS